MLFPVDSQVKKFLPAFIPMLSAAHWTAQPLPIISKVIGIADGDTVTVLQDRTQHKIRLYGIAIGFAFC
jgi:endonuclease YncB( thermonuclease family)